MIDYIYNDGGRQDAGFRGEAGDCVVRAIAIAGELDYQMVYDTMANEMKANGYAKSGNNYVTNDRNRKTPRKRGQLNAKKVQEKVLVEFGFNKVKMGNGCKPTYSEAFREHGTCIVSTSHHMAALKNGALQDLFDGREYDYGDIAGERKAMSIWVRGA